jgi:hypothetical protein
MINIFFFSKKKHFFENSTNHILSRFFDYQDYRTSIQPSGSHIGGTALPILEFTGLSLLTIVTIFNLCVTLNLNKWWLTGPLMWLN